MPTYRFVDHDTKKEWTEYMGISECEEYLKANPNVERLVNGAPLIVSKVGTFGYKRRTPDSFRDLMKNAKKKNPGSTIDVL